MKSTKRMKIIQKKLHEKKIYTIKDGILLLKELSKTNFVESVDVSINLGINPKKSDQNIRGITILPHGIGRTIRVAVFTQGDNVTIAKKLNVDFIGMQDLAEKITNKLIKFNVDIVIATPDAMKIVGKIGPYLGPRGLMPNPKLGTVTTDLHQAIIRAQNGQIRYRNDKNGIIHATIGKITFENEKLKDNLTTFLNAIKKSKPPQSKGTYIKKIMLSTTMGGAVNINLNTLE